MYIEGGQPDWEERLDIKARLYSSRCTRYCVTISRLVFISSSWTSVLYGSQTGRNGLISRRVSVSGCVLIINRYVLRLDSQTGRNA